MNSRSWRSLSVRSWTRFRTISWRTLRMGHWWTEDGCRLLYGKDSQQWASGNPDPACHKVLHRNCARRHFLLSLYLLTSFRPKSQKILENKHDQGHHSLLSRKAYPWRTFYQLGFPLRGQPARTRFLASAVEILGNPVISFGFHNKGKNCTKTLELRCGRAFVGWSKQ